LLLDEVDGYRIANAHVDMPLSINDSVQSYHIL